LRWLQENLGWIVDLWLKVRGRALARNAGYLILAAIALETDVVQLLLAGLFGAFGVSLTVSETPHYVAIIFAAFAVLLLVIERVLPEKTALPTVYPHDEQLMRTVRRTYTSGLDHFLRVHAFGNGSFNWRVLDPLDEFRSWRGTQCEFVNEEVNKAWGEVRAAAFTLMEEVADKTISVRGSVDRATPFRDDEDHDWHTQEMIDRCKVLDDAADKVVEKWDKFDALARRQITNVV
jgi:hypothetical protein